MIHETFQLRNGLPSFPRCGSIFKEVRAAEIEIERF